MTELAPEELLDEKYRIVRLIGRGAWATVYEGINLRIQRRVAIKVLNPELAANPELLTRFRREAEACVQIQSPYVVDVFDAGTHPDGRPYIVMEYLEGENLQARIERVGALDAVTAATYGAQLLTGLADAHAHGVLHRDVKPENIVVVLSKTGEEILKLIDFGISKPTEARPEMLAMTRTELVLGSPVYMSPEQARGTRHMDARSDLYSVGIVLYEILTLELPHEAANFNELMFKIALEDAPDPRSKKPDLDPDLAEIIMVALSRDPEGRFQNATEFRDALLAWIDAHTIDRPRSTLVTSKIRIRNAESSGRFPAAPAVFDAADEARRSSLTGEKPVVKSLHTSSTGPTSVSPSMPTPKPSRGAPIAIGIALGILLLGGSGWFVTHRHSTPATTTPPPPATPDPTPSPTPSPAPSPTPSPVVTADPPPASATPSAAVAATPTAPKWGPMPKPHVPPTTTPSSKPIASTAPPATAPPTTAPTSTAVEGRSVRTTF